MLLDAWGRIFTTGLNGFSHFQNFRGQKIQVGRDLKKRNDVFYIKFNKCVNSIQDNLALRLYKEGA